MKQLALISIGFLFFAAPTFAEEAASPQRMKEVEQQREKLMPYDASKVVETFSKTVHGGVMHVIAKPDAPDQIELIQNHLRQLSLAFAKGDFSISEKMHGPDMPGLLQLKTAKTDDIRYEYKSLPNGAQIHFSTEYPQFDQALHEWLNAQNKDHGNVVMPEHMKHHTGVAE